ncbi:hypothetical protein NKG99_07120 [Mesorhizobium sp. M1409]|uniref:hypothetical protein n=1 Tax=unclassified Mesorhizobium TaxID=325217 RepID=UPI0033364E5D
MMNRWLSDMLATLNVALAFMITFLGGIVGSQWANTHDRNALVGIIIGALTGFVIAASICGTLATFMLIENHLRNLRALAEEDFRRSRKQ